MVLHPLAQILPQVLVNEIFSYDPQHREYMKGVMNDLLFAHHKWNMGPVFDELIEQECDNEYCSEIITLYSDESESRIILNNLYHFCCENCAGQGEWSIRYDYRKAMRRRA
jgi:hypothetical protein